MANNSASPLIIVRAPFSLKSVKKIGFCSSTIAALFAIIFLLTLKVSQNHQEDPNQCDLNNFLLQHINNADSLCHRSPENNETLSPKCITLLASIVKKVHGKTIDCFGRSSRVPRSSKLIKERLSRYLSGSSLFSALTNNNQNQLEMMTVDEDKMQIKFMRDYKQVCFVCRGSCGGIGDRFRGMIFAFFVALGNSAGFCLEMNYPVPFDWFFKFPSDDQRSAKAYHYLSHDKIEFLDLWQDFAVFTDNGGLAEYEDARIMQASKANYVVMRGNSFDWKLLMQHSVYREKFKRFYPFLLNLREDELAAIAMSILIGDATEDLKEEISKRISFEDFKGKEYVGVHLRMGDSGLNHGQAGRRSLEDIACFVREIEQKCKYSDETAARLCHVFLACDDEKAAKLVLESFTNNDRIRVTMLPGSPLHVDQSAQEYNLIPFEAEAKAKDLKSILFKAYAKTFADWYLLSGSFHFILSDSGFGYSAFHYSLGRQNLTANRNVTAVKFNSVQKCQWISNFIFQP